MTVAAPSGNLRQRRVPTGHRPPTAILTVSSSRIDPLSDPAWDRLAGSHPCFSVFHSSAWSRVLHATYGHEPVYHSLSIGSELAALVPTMEIQSPLTGRRGVCLPFTDACSPLYFGESDKSEAVLDHLLHLARERKWKYLELRGNPQPAPPAKPSVAFYHHTLNLRNGTDELLGQCASPVRRAIRKAERSGLTAAIRTDRTALLDFYRLHCQTRKRHGLPPQPVSFFLNIQEHVIAPGLGFIVLVHWQSRPVAGAVFFHTHGRAIYKFGASDASLHELRGNNLAMWEGIRALTQLGCATLDFGRTSLIQAGLRRFKSSWGTEERIIKYCKFDLARQTWVESRDKSSGFHTAIFRHLPLPVNRMAGALLYPHLD